MRKDIKKDHAYATNKWHFWYYRYRVSFISMSLYFANSKAGNTSTTSVYSNVLDDKNPDHCSQKSYMQLCIVLKNVARRCALFLKMLHAGGVHSHSQHEKYPKGLLFW